MTSINVGKNRLSHAAITCCVVWLLWWPTSCRHASPTATVKDLDPTSNFEVEHKDVIGSQLVYSRFKASTIESASVLKQIKYDFNVVTFDIQLGTIGYEDFHLLSSDGYIKGLVHRSGTSDMYAGDIEAESSQDHSLVLENDARSVHVGKLKSTVKDADLPAVFASLTKALEAMSDQRVNGSLVQIKDLGLAIFQATVQTFTASDGSVIKLLQGDSPSVLPAIERFKMPSEEFYHLKSKIFGVASKAYEVTVRRHEMSPKSLMLDVVESVGPIKLQVLRYKLTAKPSGAFDLSETRYGATPKTTYWTLQSDYGMVDEGRPLSYFINYGDDKQNDLVKRVIPKVKFLLMGMPNGAGSPLVSVFDHYLAALASKELNIDVVKVVDLPAPIVRETTDEAAKDGAVDLEKGAQADSADAGPMVEPSRADAGRQTNASSGSARR